MAAVKKDNLNSSFGSVSCSDVVKTYRLTTQWAMLEERKWTSNEEYFSIDRSANKRTRTIPGN